MGKQRKQCQNLFWEGSKITADGDYSHKIKRHLHIGRKFMANLDSILKSRDITLPTKFRLVKAMVFPVVMYGCDRWTVKKAEHRRIDAFLKNYKFIYFNWRLIALQYCIGFAIHQHESTTGINVF